MKKKPQQQTHSESGPLSLLSDTLEIEAASSLQPDRQRRFSMVAYTGGPMKLGGWRFPVVVDLAGIDLGRQRRPILLDHTRDVDFVMGQTDRVNVENNQLLVSGEVLGDSEKARRVIALNDRGFSWQASVGARADEEERGLSNLERGLVARVAFNRIGKRRCELAHGDGGVSCLGHERWMAQVGG